MVGSDVEYLIEGELLMDCMREMEIDFLLLL